MYAIVGMMTSAKLGSEHVTSETFATADEARVVASWRSRSYTLSVVRVEPVRRGVVRLVEWL